MWEDYQCGSAVDNELNTKLVSKLKYPFVDWLLCKEMHRKIWVKDSFDVRFGPAGACLYV